MECSRLPPGAFPTPTPTPTPRRVFTAPTSTTSLSSGLLQRAESSSSTSRSSQGGSVETLYSHPSVKIIAFTSSARAVPRGPSEEEVGSLSWSSQLERTIAVGAFRIYRAPGSVAFLNCGSALQPILPKSQCWCIEEDSSRFVLQIRRPNFWRIELPVADVQDRHRAELLKDVFGQILLFEKTQCPFQRTFTIKLPEPPQTPVRKKPWTPARRSFTPVSASASAGAMGCGVLGSPSPEPKAGRAVSEPPVEARVAVPKTSEEPRREEPVLASRSAEDEPEADNDTSKRAAEKFGKEKAIPKETEVLGVELDTVLVQPGNDVKEEAIVPDVEPSEADKPASAPAERNPSPPIIISSFEQNLDPPTELVPVQAAERECVEQSKEESRISAQPTPEQADGEEIARIETPVETPVKARTATPVKVREVVEAIEERLPAKAKSPEAQEKSPEAQADTPAPTQEPEVSTPTKPLVRKTSIPFIRNVREPRRRESSEVLRVPSTPATPVKPPVILETAPIPEVEIAEVEEEAEEAKAKEDSYCTSNSDEQADESKGVLEGSGHGGDLLLKKKLRRNGFATSRGSTAPPQLTLVTSPLSKSANSKQVASVPEAQPRAQPEPHTLPQPKKEERKRRSDSTSTDSADSFHSVQSETWQSPVTSSIPSPSPSLSPAAGENVLENGENQSTFPYPHDNILLPRQAPHHQRGVSDLTVTPTPDARLIWDEMSMSSGDLSQESAMTAPDHGLERIDERIDECAKSAISDDGVCSSSTATAVRRGRPSLRHRTTTSISTRRAFSPLPPAATLFSPTTSSSRRKPPPRRTRMELVRRIPFAIIAKTCEILFGPPAHLVTLMLQVAAKIAAGEWRGLVFGFGDDGERIDVRWDYSDDDLSDWEHDAATSPLYGGGGRDRDRGRVVEEVDDSDDDGDHEDGKRTTDDESGRSWGVD